MMTCMNLLPRCSWFGLVLVFGLLGLGSLSAATDPLDLPLPLVGTDLHGHTYPGATVPFGMVQLSPDTRVDTWDGCSGYHYSDSTILGFSHTHLSGTGCANLGDLLLMPTVGELRLNPGPPGSGYAARFSHDQETATPGYYSVRLQDSGLLVELTATERCGFHRYTFPARADAHIILDLAHGISSQPVDAGLLVENDTTISGYRTSTGWGGRRTAYFVMQFSRPFTSFGIQRDGHRLTNPRTAVHGKKLQAYVNYDTQTQSVILVKVGLSATSVEGARKNLTAELPGWNFAAARAAARSQWQKALAFATVDSTDPHVRATFYANLYLSCLAPVLFNDVDGTYRGLDQKNHVGDFQNYTTLSIWDIYRAEWPLLTLMQPARVNDLVKTMLAGYAEYGRHSTPIWPLWGNWIWCMIGYHSVDMITEAYLEGFRDFDAEAAYQAMRDTALQSRDGLDDYQKLGYVASHPGDKATSKTIEYTVDDWNLAKMAETLGHADDARLFYQRAANYRNVFDRSTGFFRGRLADGSWRSPFSPFDSVNDEYIEADAWQYLFAVQHDVPGMIALHGGDAGFIAQLDRLFLADTNFSPYIPDISGMIGQYSQGDEQSHHVTYLYDYAGAPYKTQQRVRQAMAQFYDDTPRGQCGNDDCGQMSAWYVFSALGFYPVNPSSGVFALGSPAVDRATLHFDPKFYPGRDFTVIATHNSPENVYVQSATLNGQPLNRPWITRAEVTAGGTLEFQMGPKPNPAWGSAPEVRPPPTMPANFDYPPLPPPAAGAATH